MTNGLVEKKVVVVGIGNSGIDVAVDAATVGRSYSNKHTKGTAYTSLHVIACNWQHHLLLAMLERNFIVYTTS